MDFIYQILKLINDITAVFGGTTTTSKRIGRRTAGRITGRAMNKIFK